MMIIEKKYFRFAFPLFKYIIRYNTTKPDADVDKDKVQSFNNTETNCLKSYLSSINNKSLYKESRNVSIPIQFTVKDKRSNSVNLIIY